MESLVLYHSLVLVSFSICALLFFIFMRVFVSIANENDTLKSLGRFVKKLLIKFKNWALGGTIG